MRNSASAIDIGGDRSFFAESRAPVHARRGAGATSHPLATAELLRILQIGGSAADAAVAAAAVLAVVEPHMTGIGGDCFAMVKKPGSPPQALDGAGWAPRRFRLLRRMEDGDACAVTVPGALAAWHKLHARHGRLPWRSLFDAACFYAAEGFALPARVAQDWAEFSGRLQDVADAVFLPGKKLPRTGDVITQKKLAATLRAATRNGAREFYEGATAAAMRRTLRSAGGAHDAADFADYWREGARWTTPWSVRYRGWRVWECPPPGQGAAALLMLSAMQDEPSVDTAVGLHRFAQITREAYLWRDRELGDGFPASPRFLKKEAEAIRARIRRSPPAALPSAPRAHRDTVCLCAADESGMVVSLINSLFFPFGSGIMCAKTGVLFHNRGFGFAGVRHDRNTAAPRRRPLHTIIPAVAEGPRGEALAFGVMGGHYQAAGHAWLLARLLDCGEDLQAALDAPRVFNYPGALHAEPGFPPRLLAALRKRGHRIRTCKSPLGGGQAVLRRRDGLLVAASDPRKDGMAAGI